MNSKRYGTKSNEKSSLKSILDIRALHELISTSPDLRDLYEDGVNEFITHTALLAIRAVIDAEIERKCGKPHQRSKQHPCYRHGRQKTGYIIINGQKHRFEKPRIVTRGARRLEVPLETYRDFQSNGILQASVLAKMLHGVSTRDYRAAAEAIQDAYGIEKSSVSRHFVRASADALRKFDERPIDRYFPIIFIDGYEVGGDIMMIALGIDENGVKMVLSMRQGGSENEGVINSMFDDMQHRGLQKDRPILFVIDGSKAIHAAITRRYTNCFIQRCREHKKRNILDHAPVAMKEEVRRRINEAYEERDYEKARAGMLSLASWAERINPDMGRSVREGMEETLTVLRLGVSPFLYKSVCSTNPIESLNSSLECFAHRVKKWRGGDMKKRWLASAILKAEERMHRVRGFVGIRSLVANMEKVLEEQQRHLDRKTS
jgi:transposase-like protein